MVSGSGGGGREGEERSVWTLGKDRATRVADGLVVKTREQS